MKRFYCTVCKRIKRVRKYPTDVLSPLNENPANRVGTCTYHHVGKSHIPVFQPRKAQKVGA